MNYLILGANGYLGSKIAQSLISKENVVFCVIRKNSDISRLEIIKDDVKIISTEEIEIVLQEKNINCVINTVCNYSQKISDYEVVLNANLNFPLSVLNDCIKNKIETYLTIDTSLPAELNMYSMAKNELNRFGKFFCERHALNFYTLQLEMFYGADEPENRFIPSMVRKMLEGSCVDTTLGTQKRDIIAVNDVVKAVNMILNSNLEGYHEVAVGTGVAPTVSEIVDYIWEVTGKKATIHKGKIPMRPNEPDCIANIEKLQSLGEWNPCLWKDGIREMIESIVCLMK